MALAGPGANLLLVLVAALALKAGELAGVFYAPQEISFGDIAGTDAGAAWHAAGRILGAFFSMNLLLCVLNLLPFPPLDGSAAIMLFMRRETQSKYQEFLWSTPLLGFVGLLVAWQLFGYMFRPVFAAAVSLLYPGSNYG